MAHGREPDARDDHSSGTAVAGRLERSTRATARKRVGPVPALAGPGPVAPIRSCSRWGLPCRRRCRLRGALLPHPFTLTRTADRSPAGRSALCGAVPGVTPAGRYPAPCFRGARTFLRARARRPSGRLARRAYRTRLAKGRADGSHQPPSTMTHRRRVTPHERRRALRYQRSEGSTAGIGGRAGPPTPAPAAPPGPRCRRPADSARLRRGGPAPSSDCRSASPPAGRRRR